MSHNVLFEIGIEELPARFIDQAESDLVEKTKIWLEQSRIRYESITSYSTPRRLAVLIEKVAELQESKVEEVRGPSEEIAKDEKGNWTQAAIGFTKGQGKTTEDIYIKDVNGTNYIFIEKKTEGKHSKEILPEFKQIVTSLQFPQTMRWGSLSFRFPRPIRWLLAICDDEVIPFEIANVKTNNKTYGHRFLGNEVIVTDPLQYEKQLEDNYVIANAERREEMIVNQIKEIEAEQQFNVIIDDDLLNEVHNLVEYPTAFFGTFKKEYLTLPSEVLITSMKEHQRYFPVKNDKDELLAYFVGVRNGDETDMETIVRGNEKVLRARLADGEFFYTEDQKVSLDEYLERLKSVVFQEKIGTLSEKVDHVMTITTQIAEKLNTDDETKHHARRAAEICKFDLVTNMVDEFPELQGIMGEKYAINFGEDVNVAKAVREHYLPTHASGQLPSSVIGSLVSVADKLDTIVGTISIGLLPSGSQDPYGLRRQAIGILRIVEQEKWNVSVESLLDIAIKIYEITDKETIETIQNFFKQRASYLLSEEGIEQDVIQSVLHDKIGNYTYTRKKAKILSEKRHDESFKQIEQSLVRVMNLANDEQNQSIDEQLFETESEKALYDALQTIKEQYTVADNEHDAKKALDLLTQLAEPINTFFDNNMVMAEDMNIRNNRLALVNEITNLINQFANLKLIEWKQHH